MMLTPCWPSAGPTGGAGLARPALICSLMIAASFFFLGGISVFLFRVVPRGGPARHRVAARLPAGNRSDLGDLGERQLDRSLATEDRHEHLQLLAVRVDLTDGSGQRGEGAVHNGDGLADLEVDLD